MPTQAFYRARARDRDVEEVRRQDRIRQRKAQARRKAGIPPDPKKQNRSQPVMPAPAEIFVIKAQDEGISPSRYRDGDPFSFARPSTSAVGLVRFATPACARGTFIFDTFGGDFGQRKRSRGLTSLHSVFLPALGLRQLESACKFEYEPTSADIT